MAASDLPSLGPLIRAERLRRGLSLRALAREVGVSASMLSQIETAKSRPSVKTLYAITTALRMSIEDAFSAGPLDSLPLDGLPPDGGPTRDGRRVAGPDGQPADGSASDGRGVLRLDSGVTWQRLGELPGRNIDFLLITYEPGGTSSSGGELMRHPGAEYGYLLSGELVLTLGFQQRLLRAGDSVSFESSTPHGYRNDSTEPAVGVWFVVEEPIRPRDQPGKGREPR